MVKWQKYTTIYFDVHVVTIQNVPDKCYGILMCSVQEVYRFKTIVYMTGTSLSSGSWSWHVLCTCIFNV